MNYSIEHLNELPVDVSTSVCEGHIQDEAENGVVCNYGKFAIVIKNDHDVTVGAL